jgi:hypothetical protein
MSAQLRLPAQPHQPQQTKLSFLPRLPPTVRPGPKPVAPTQLNVAVALGGRPVGGRRRIGGNNEQLAINAFEESRARFAQGLGEASDDEDGDTLRHSRRRRRRLGYTREKKLQAILYMERTYEKDNLDGTPGKILSRSRAAKTLGVTTKMLRDWKRREKSILAQKAGSKRARGQDIGRQPELEYKLHSLFKEARAAGRIIGSRWFMKNGRKIYREMYPRRCAQDEDTGRWSYAYFRFSNGWFQKFRKRYHIAIRSKTKQAQKPPEDFREKILAWLRFNRRQTVINPSSDCGVPRDISVPVVGRFKLSEIANMDQTPIAFEFLQGCTYDTKGVKTVWIKEQRSGWDRRQATLQVCVYADGIQRCRPLLIFHGHPVGDSRRRAEEKLYDKGVAVAFNDTAWADASNLKDWVKKQYAVGSAFLTREHEPRLLSLDAFAPQMTAAVRDEFKKLNCETSYIPGGCTGFVQVLDVALNKMIKDMVAQAAEDHYDQHTTSYEEGKFTVGERRVLLTKWVAVAWKRLHEEKKDVIIKTFRQVGLSLNPDGSEDHELKIKGLDNLVIGDYLRPQGSGTDGLESLLLNDIQTINDIKAQLAIKVEAKRVKHQAKLNTITSLPLTVIVDDESDREHEESLTLGRMYTRSQARVNTYYTAEETLEDIDELALNIEDIADDTIVARGPYNSDDDGGFDTDEAMDIDGGGYIEDDDIEFQDKVDGDLDQEDENMD